MNEAEFLAAPTHELAKAGRFDLLCAAWDLQLLIPESAPRVMQEAMCFGHTGDAVVHVAGLIAPTRADNARGISSAFHSLPGAPASRQDALKILATFWLERVATGSDADVEMVLQAADTAYATLDYPGQPFSTFVYFHDMNSWDEEGKPLLEDVLGSVRKWAVEYLSDSSEEN